MTKEYIADLILAEANLYNQVREQGFNKGRDVEVFQKAVDSKASGEPWCMCFVQFIVKKVALDLGIRTPLFPSEHCQTVWNNTLEMYKRKLPSKGTIALWRKRGSSNGHTGIALDSGTVYFNTIEGNTNEAGSREGDGVYKKKRLVAGGKMELRGFIDAPQMIFDKLPQAKKTV